MKTLAKRAFIWVFLLFFLTSLLSAQTARTESFQGRDAVPPIVPPPISPGQAISEALSTTDPLDPLFPGQNRYADYYQLTLGSTTQITIDMRSTAFQTWLGLVSSSGTLLVVSTNTWGSQISRTLSAGTYYIDASSNLSGVTGAYTISIDVLPAVTSVMPSFGVQGTPLNVTLTGNRFASPMTVNAGGGITVSNVNVSSSTSATATFTIAPGATVGANDVAATTAIGTSNAVAFSILPPIPAISPGPVISGALATTDPFDPLYPDGNFYADFYQLTLNSSAQITLDMRSTSFQTYLVLLSSTGAILEVDSNTWGSHISITLSAGTYYVDASSFTSLVTGPYTLLINKRARGQVTSQ